MALLQYVDQAPPGSWTWAAIGLMNSGGIRASIDETAPDGSMYIDIRTNYSSFISSYAIQCEHFHKRNGDILEWYKC
jgi:hypothetical protein